jgi:hypothetical protein
VSDHKEGETSIAHVKDSMESLKFFHLLTGIMHTMGMTRKDNELSKHDSHVDSDP